MSSVDRKAFRFFLEHAGYSTPPGRAVCAISLARAEALLAEAVELGAASVRWDWDPEPYEHGFFSDEEISAKFESNEWTGPFGCIVEAGSESVSLWGIVVGPRGTNDPYCRVVAAEFASELEDDLRQAIGDARDSLTSTESEVSA